MVGIPEALRFQLWQPKTARPSSREAALTALPISTDLVDRDNVRRARTIMFQLYLASHSTCIMPMKMAFPGRKLAPHRTTARSRSGARHRAPARSVSGVTSTRTRAVLVDRWDSFPRNRCTSEEARLIRTREGTTCGLPHLLSTQLRLRRLPCRTPQTTLTCRSPVN
jgi:hypothetical protein